jgi:nicotinamidase-related amidase
VQIEPPISIVRVDATTPDPVESTMPARNLDLHGSVPDQCPIALLLIDLINDFDFPEAPKLLEYALPMAKRIDFLAQRARGSNVPVIYVNDNFGRWRSDFKAQVEHCLNVDNPGRNVVELMRPKDDDYFILKPKHSGFYSSSLDILLGYLGVKTVILTGIATNICVLFTANDAYMRDLHLIVPQDCVASNTREDNEYALAQMKSVLKADTRASAELDFADLAKAAAGETSSRIA